MTRLLLIGFLCLISFPTLSQNGNFRSIASGRWDSPSTWERDSNSDGIFEDSPASMAPNIGDGIITIRSGHVVRIYVNTSIDQTVVEYGGRLAINTTNVIVENGDGVDLLNSGTVSTANSSQLTFAAFSEFEHSKNGGALPLATWGDNSICTISGVTTGAPANLNQPAPGFHTFNWRCPGQSTTVYLDGKLINVRGDLNIMNTNNFVLNFSSSSAPTPIAVGGNLNVTGNSAFHLTNSANVTVNLNGSFNFFTNSSSPSVLVTHSGSVTLNIGGSMNIDTNVGTLDFSGGSGTGLINLLGDFNLLNGSLTETGTSIGQLRFTGNERQSFTNTATISNQIDFTIEEGSTVSVLGESPIIGRTLNVNGNLRVGSINPTGAIVTGTTLGNVRTNFRNYSDGSRIIYAATAAQFIGNGHPSTVGVDTEIDNASGVTFNTTTQGNNGSSTLWIRGDLTLTAGNLNVVSTTTGRSLRLEGTIIANENFVTIAGSNTDLKIEGSGVFGNFPLPPGEHTLRAFTLNRPDGTVSFDQGLTIRTSVDLLNGFLDFNSSASLNGSVSVGAGTTLFFEGQSLTLAGTFSSSGGSLSADDASTLVLTGISATTCLSHFSPVGNSLNTVRLDKPSSGIVAEVTAPLTVTGSLELVDGQLDITGGNLSLANGATLSRSSIASISGSSPSGGPWHLIYTLGSLQTGLEIPPSGSLETLTLSSSDGSSIVLSNDVVINSNLTIPQGVTLNCSDFSVAAGSVVNEGSFIGPSTIATSGLVISGDFDNDGVYGSSGVLTLSGNLTNNGTFSSGTMIFNGVSQILGSSPVAFHHVEIEGTLVSPNPFEISGDFTNNGTFDSNNGVVNFNGTSVQTISGTSVTTFNDINIINIISPVSVSIQSDQQLRGVLTLAPGSIFDADGAADNAEFTILSDGNGDGSIAALPVSSTLAGNITIQRFLEASGKDYRFISSPVTAAPVSQLQDDFRVTGSFTGSDDVNAGPSLRYYHEAFKGSFENGYAATPVTNGTNAETLVPGRGYSSYMWDGETDITMDVRGTINRGLVNFTNVRHTVSDPAEPDADGWNLIGNPYPSAIQWNNGSGWVRSENIDPTVWVWDVLQGVWRSYNYDSPGGATLADGIIASGQAFWIYVHPSGPANISINEGAKYSGTGSGIYYRTRNESFNGLAVSLTGNGTTDNALISFNKNGTRGFDFGLDSYKPEFGIESISLSVLNNEGQKLASYVTNSADPNATEFPLWISAKAMGNYEISFSNWKADPAFGSYQLFDKYKGAYSSLDQVYKFSITNNPATKGDRFVITKGKVELTNFSEVEVFYFPNPVESILYVDIGGQEEVESSLLNYVGETIQRIELVRYEGGSRAEINMSSLPSGLYLLKVQKSNVKSFTYKVLKK